MEPLGGRSAVLRAAVVALLLAAAACSNGSDDVDSTSATPTTSASEATVAGDGDGDGTTSTTAGRTSTTAAGGSTTTAAPSPTTTAPSSTTTTPAPTTRAPTTRAPTTTAPPPTTAAPPPPTTTTTAPPPTTTAPPPPSGPQHGTRNTGCEQYMYNRINEARGNVGRPALAFDAGIQYIPLEWADEMARTQVLAHNPDYGSRIFAARAQAQTAAENVGRGYSNESLFTAFMNSPGHRSNIESPNFSHITIGCLTDSGGQLWVAQNFWG